MVSLTALFRALLLSCFLLALTACGNNFFADPNLFQLDHHAESVDASDLELREGYVLVGDLAVHRSQIDEEDLKNLFPEEYEAHIEEVKQSGVFESNINTWPGGVMPLTFRGLNRNQQNQVLSFCEEMARNANIRCKRRENESDYVEVQFSSRYRCGGSYYGRIGGKQELWLYNDSECFVERTIKHEIMHAFGVGHEQNRIDRDQFVDIHWNNMNQSSRSNFAKITVDTVKTGQYDFDSIMHYASFQSQRMRGLHTITRKQRVRVAPSNCQYPNPSYPDNICRNGGMTDLIPLNRVPSALDNQILSMVYGQPQSVEDNRDFVRQVFQDFFNRMPGDNGLNYWTTQLQTKNENIVKRDILVNSQGSDRNFLINNRSQEARQFLTENGFAIPSWLLFCSPGTRNECGSIANGKLFQTCNGDGTAYGACNIVECNSGYRRLGNSCVAMQAPVTPQGENVIKAIYQKYFNRMPEMAGLNYWAQQLQSRSATVVEKDIIYGASSTNGSMTASGLSDRSYIIQNTANSARSFLLGNGFSLPNWLAVCSPNTIRFCRNISNGAIYARCNSTLSGFGSCSLVRCNSGYQQSGTSCVRVTPTPTPTPSPTPQLSADERAVNAIYQRYFSRNAEQAGLNYWTPLYRSRGATVTEKDIIFGASTTVLSGQTKSDRQKIIDSPTRARNFLMSNGFPLPNWLK